MTSLDHLGKATILLAISLPSNLSKVVQDAVVESVIKISHVMTEIKVIQGRRL